MTPLTDRRPGARGGSYGPVLRWPGAKWQIAPWIVQQLPAHRAYCEPFAGSAAVLCHKPPAAFEVINDLDGDVVNLFRVLRESPADLAAALEMTPYARDEYQAALGDLDVEAPAGPDVERARRFVVRSWGGMGTPHDRTSGWRRQMHGDGSISAAWSHLPERVMRIAERLRSVQIESRPALDLISTLDGSDVLLYVDPPYLPDIRDPRLYRVEMTRADHEALLMVLAAYSGPVVLSGYDDPLYDAHLASWERRTIRAKTRRGARLEVLWLNPPASRHLVLPWRYP